MYSKTSQILSYTHLNKYTVCLPDIPLSVLWTVVEKFLFALEIQEGFLVTKASALDFLDLYVLVGSKYPHFVEHFELCTNS